MYHCSAQLRRVPQTLHKYRILSNTLPTIKADETTASARVLMLEDCSPTLPATAETTGRKATINGYLQQTFNRTHTPQPIPHFLSTDDDSTSVKATNISMPIVIYNPCSILRLVPLPGSYHR